MKNKIIKSCFAGWLILLCHSICSCTEDFQNIPLSGERIIFNISKNEEWKDTRSRSSRMSVDSEEPYVDVLISESDTYNAPLYLHVLSESSCGSLSNLDHSLSRGYEAKDVYTTMSVTGLVYDGSITDALPNFMENEKIEGSGDKWSTNRFWPNGDKNIKFFAHSPYTSKGLMYGYPCLSYETPSSVEDQTDILVGESPELTGKPTNGEVLLNFSHPLTAVTFVAGDGFETGTITRITLKNIFSKGNFNVLSGQWESLDKRTDFTIDLTDCYTNGKFDIAINGDETTFMMIPQTFDDSMSEVEIEFEDALTGTSHTLKFKLSGEWEKGKRVCYSLSTNPQFIQNVFKCNLPKTITSEYDGFINLSPTNKQKLISFDIESYAIIVEPGKRVYKQVEFNKDFVETNNNWLHIDLKPYEIEDGGFGVGCFHGILSIDQQFEFTEISPHDSNLRKAIKKTERYNLSNSNGGSTVENTANCYIINAPGKYKLPLVYGNGIKNNNFNKEAYTNPINFKDGKNRILTFVKHNGDTISSPFIEIDENVNPCVFWADAKNMISNIQIKNNFLEFDIFNDVDTIEIVQSNAVIGIKDKESGNAIWSWHIWVTDYNLHDDIEIESYRFMQLNLGWCFGNIKNYEGREVCLSLIQKDIHGNDLPGRFDIEIIQLPHKENTMGNNTYYQWGRKDPFPGGLGFNIEKPIYMGTFYCNSMINGGETIASAISKPNVMFITSSAKWCAIGKAYNMWNAVNLSTAPQYIDKSTIGNMVKTIYDPSPIGYMVPSPECFLPIEGKISWNTNINEYAYQVGGKYFILPITGYRVRSSGIVTLSDDEKFGRLSSSKPRTTSSSYLLFHFCLSTKSGTSMIHSDAVYQSTGLPIRSLREPE